MPVSILRTATNVELSDSVFDDLHLTRLLPDKTVRILARPLYDPDVHARIAEIKRRQSVFAYLETEAGFKNLHDCHGVLKEYARDLRLYRSTSIDVEKRFLFRTVLDEYLQVAETLAALTEPAFEQVSAYWKKQVEQLANLHSDLETADQALATVGTWNLCLGTEGGTTYMTSDTLAHESYLKRLSDAADELHMEVPDTKTNRIRLNDALAHAIEELFPEIIAQLDNIYEPYRALPFDEPCAYIEELDFLFSILALVGKAHEKDIPTCYPTPCETPKYLGKNLYDVTLFIKEAEHIVPNDTFFDTDCPFFFLTGANGGGKTTYLRAICLNLVLFLSGCPIFADSAEIYPFTKVLSHFPADERFSVGGRLEEEQRRVDAMLKETDGDSFLVFNETFSGTDDKLGAELTLKTAAGILEKKASGLFVTHFHEVRSGGIPILNTVIDETEGNRRTFRVVRDLGMSSSFALDILKKYRLDAESLKARRFTEQ